MDQSRRDFLKKGAIVGGAVWTAPSIVTVSSALAASSPRPCACTTCTASATAVAVTGVVALGTASGSGCSCPLTVPVGPVTVTAACAKADNASCSASSYVANVSILLTATTFLKATVLSSCVQCGTGTSIVTDLAVDVMGTSTPLTLSSNCNGTPVNVNVGGVNLATVVFNDQTCSSGVLTVAALVVTILASGVVVRLAESKAGAAGCACNACSGSATCSAPTSTLCPTA